MIVFNFLNVILAFIILITSITCCAQSLNIKKGHEPFSVTHDHNLQAHSNMRLWIMLLVVWTHSLRYDPTSVHWVALSTQHEFCFLFIHWISQTCLLEGLCHLFGVLHLSWQCLKNIVLIHGSCCPVNEGPHRLKTSHAQINPKSWRANKKDVKINITGNTCGTSDLSRFLRNIKKTVKYTRNIKNDYLFKVYIYIYTILYSLYMYWR